MRNPESGATVKLWERIGRWALGEGGEGLSDARVLDASRTGGLSERRQEPEFVPFSEDRGWMDRVRAVVDEAHEENLGGKHRTGFCEACADAYLVAQRAVPRTPSRGQRES